MGQVASLDMPRRLAAAAGAHMDLGWEQHGRKTYEAPSGPVSALYSQHWDALGDLCLHPSGFLRVAAVVFPA